MRARTRTLRIEPDQAYPEIFTGSIPYALPVSLVAVGAFGYGLTRVLEELREQRAVNSRLSELQAQYSVAEDLAVMGSWVYDLSEDRFYWSDGCYRVFGMQREQGPPTARPSAPYRSRSWPTGMKIRR